MGQLTLSCNHMRVEQLGVEYWALASITAEGATAASPRSVSTSCIVPSLMGVQPFVATCVFEEMEFNTLAASRVHYQKETINYLAHDSAWNLQLSGRVQNMDDPWLLWRSDVPVDRSRLAIFHNMGEILI
jgi:hypothetical protein